MNVTIGELILSVLLALGVGFAIGSEKGWDMACTYAQQLAKQHRTGELLVQVPAKYNPQQVIWGSEWISGKLCDGR